jgi:hypothetical protein
MSMAIFVCSGGAQNEPWGNGRRLFIAAKSLPTRPEK